MKMPSQNPYFANMSRNAKKLNSFVERRVITYSEAKDLANIFKVPTHFIHESEYRMLDLGMSSSNWRTRYEIYNVVLKHFQYHLDFILEAEFTKQMNDAKTHFIERTTQTQTPQAP